MYKHTKFHILVMAFLFSSFSVFLLDSNNQFSSPLKQEKRTDVTGNKEIPTPFSSNSVENLGFFSSIDTSGSSLDSFLWGNILLIADGENGLVSVNASNSKNPVVKCKK